MRILHVIHTLDPAAGGPAAVAPRLAAAQAHLGHDVDLLTYRFPNAELDIRNALRGVPDADRIAIRSVAGLGPWERLSARRARAHAEELTAAADVVHAHGVWLPIIRIACASARRHGTPYVIRPAGSLDPWSLAQKGLKKRIALALAYRRMLDGASWIHALNQDERHGLESLGLAAPLEIVSNGVFPEELEPLPAAGSFHRAHPELAGRRFVLFLSRLHHKKGLDLLALAWSRLSTRYPDLHLVVAGPDHGAGHAFRQQIRTSGLHERVHLVGPLYGTEKLAALVDATCFCLPTRQEGFSMAVTEALACGLPVVTTHQCHFPEIAEVGAGMVTELDPEAISRALHHVLADDTRRAEMGAAGRQLIHRRFTWHQVARRCLDLYGQYLARGMPGADDGSAADLAESLGVVTRDTY